MASMKHIVLFKFKEETEEAEIDAIFEDLAGLRELIPGMLDFIAGPYESDEGMNQGFTHGFIMTFEDAAARDGYLPHPEHKRVKARILPAVESVIAFDFEV